jgi:hypothetical protein
MWVRPDRSWQEPDHVGIVADKGGPNRPLRKLSASVLESKKWPKTDLFSVSSRYIMAN